MAVFFCFEFLLLLLLLFVLFFVCLFFVVVVVVVGGGGGGGEGILGTNGNVFFSLLRSNSNKVSFSV